MKIILILSILFISNSYAMTTTRCGGGQCYNVDTITGRTSHYRPEVSPSTRIKREFSGNSSYSNDNDYIRYEELTDEEKAIRNEILEELNEKMKKVFPR